jgi:acyl-CoA synthetase (NDP forming)
MKLDRLLNPKSMAVFGVSLKNPFNPANVIYHKNKLRYIPDAYAINPRGGELYGERIYSDLDQTEQSIDLAILSVRSKYVPEILFKCVDRGVGGAIIISGGFAEVGNHAAQQEIEKIARENDFPVIGPNCLGVYCPPYADVFFLPYERFVEPRKGQVSLVSQSGGILVDQMIKLTQEGVGIARAISLGNKAVIDEVDLLNYLEHDPATKVIGIYTEGFSANRGRLFVETVQKLEKPVVVQKSGKTPEGIRAVSSHTASLAGDYRVFSEVIKQSGALEAKSESEFVAYCESLTCCQRSGLRNVGVITVSGGHGAVAVDACYKAGVSVVDIPSADQEKLKKSLSKNIQGIASFGNPIDLTGSATDNDVIAATKYLVEQDYIDCILLLLLPYIPAITTDVGARVAQVTRMSNKPVLVYLPHVDKYEIFIQGFEINGIPTSHSVEGAVHMVEVLVAGGAK